MTLMQEAMSPADPLETTGTTVPSPDRIVELGYAFRTAKVLLSAVELGVLLRLPKARPISRRSERRSASRNVALATSSMHWSPSV